jgi:hypothetical protein
MGFDSHGSRGRVTAVLTVLPHWIWLICLHNRRLYSGTGTESLLNLLSLGWPEGGAEAPAQGLVWAPHVDPATWQLS